MTDEFEKINNSSCDNININIATFMIKWYSFIEMNVTHYIKTIYAYEPIKIIADKMYYFSHIVKSKMINYHIDPIDIFWTSIVYADFDYKNNNYKYIDYYPYIQFEPSQSDNLLEAYNILYDIGNYKLSTTVEYSQIYQCLTLLKYYDKCVSRICSLTNSKTHLNLTSSTVRFLSIVYSHPKLKYTINLNIDNMYYLVDNEILSSLFILRLLNHQQLPFEFDKEYKLEVMDDNVNIINLMHDNYILLKEDKYEVININKK